MDERGAMRAMHSKKESNFGMLACGFNSLC